jgi:hypothetical protein
MPQERDLIARLFDRMQQAASQPKDRDAEALIAQGQKQVSDAPYFLVQTWAPMISAAAIPARSTFDP